MSYYYDGPSYGIKDSQQADVLGYCEECGGELYSHEQAEVGLCNYCLEDKLRKEAEEEEA